MTLNAPRSCTKALDVRKYRSNHLRNQGLFTLNPRHQAVQDVISAAPNVVPARSNVIPSEAEESKPAVSIRGAIHATKSRIEGRSSATAWFQDKVLRFLTTFGMTAEGLRYVHFYVNRP